MKTAITSTGNTPDARLSRSFGRCKFFCIVDQETESIEFVPNPYKNTVEGAGAASVMFLDKMHVQKVISGEFGLKTKPLLDSLRIQMILLKNPEIRIREIIDLLKHSV